MKWLAIFLLTVHLNKHKTPEEECPVPVKYVPYIHEVYEPHTGSFDPPAGPETKVSEKKKKRRVTPAPWMSYMESEGK